MVTAMPRRSASLTLSKTGIIRGGGAYSDDVSLSFRRLQLRLQHRAKLSSGGQLQPTPAPAPASSTDKMSRLRSLRIPGTEPSPSVSRESADLVCQQSREFPGNRTGSMLTPSRPATVAYRADSCAAESEIGSVLQNNCRRSRDQVSQGRCNCRSHPALQLSINTAHTRTGYSIISFGVGIETGIGVGVTNGR